MTDTAFQDWEAHGRKLQEEVASRHEEQDRKTRFPLPVEMYGDIAPQLDDQWLIDGLLPYEGEGVVFGPPGGGKTFVTLDMAMHVAAKRPWMGRAVDGGGVIYLAAEGQAGVRRRIDAWKRDHDCPDIPFALVPVSLDLLRIDGDIAKLVHVISSLSALEDWRGVRLIVIDTLAKTFGGGDENGSDMAAYIANINRAFAPHGCLRLIVHHQPWTSDTKRPRGHSSLLGAVDAAIHVEGDSGAPARWLTVTKQKDGEDGLRIPFKLRSVEIGTNAKGKPVTSCVVDALNPDDVLPSKPGHKLKPGERIALLALDRVTTAHGITPPADIPDEAINRVRTGKVSALSAWQAATVEALHEPDKQADTASRTFRRVRTSLQAAGIVGIHGEYVWRNWK
jgi:hypothetical protein